MSVWFFVFVSYAIVGAALAGMWTQVVASMRPSHWQLFVGILLYCSLWPVMVGIDIAEALKIQRKFRAARKRGQL